MGTKRINLPTRAGKSGKTPDSFGTKSGACAPERHTIPKTAKPMMFSGIVKGSKTGHIARSVEYASLIPRKSQVHSHNHGKDSTRRTPHIRPISWMSDSLGQSALEFGYSASTTPALERLSIDRTTSPPSGTSTVDEILQNYDDLLTKSVTPFERESFLERQRHLGREVENPIDIFIEDEDEDEDSGLSLWAKQKLRCICPPVPLGETWREQVNGSEMNSIKKRAWIDDRSFASRFRPGYRVYHNPITARQLHRALQPRRAGDSSLPDADRRLVYIEGLDGQYIYALAETALQHQRLALCEALVAHLCFETRFRFVPPHTSHGFRISMYMTFPVAFLSSSTDARPADLPHYDTTFAFTEDSDSTNAQVQCLYDARTTIEICGLSCTKYTVWAFSDVLHGTEPISSKNEEDFSYKCPSMEEQNGPHIDPIGSGALLDANLPIQDPRDYALRLMQFHVKRVVSRWRNVVQLFEAPFEKHRQNVAGILPGSIRATYPKGPQHFTLGNEIERNQSWLQLLNQYDGRLFEFLKNLDGFCAPLDGLAFMLTGLQNSLEPRYVKANAQAADIKHAVEDLRGLHNTIISRKESCEYLASQLNLCLRLEADQRHVQSKNTQLVMMQAQQMRSKDSYSRA